MFGNASKPSRIYAFKCKAPAEDMDKVMSQMILGHRYRNRLVEIERDRRDGVEVALRGAAPDVAALADRLADASREVETILAEMKRKNAAARSRVATAEDKVALKAAKERRRFVARDLREARAVAFADPSVKSSIAEPTKVASDRAREARKDSGLYWGSYLKVEQGMMGARQGAPPKFRRWDGCGSVAVQIQKGIPWSDVLSGHDSRARVILRPPSDAADPASRRSRENPMADFWLRVGSDGRSPVWAVFPFRLPRPVPADARVKWVAVYRRVVGCRAVWEIQFTLERDDWTKADNAVDGVAGLDINWRVMPDGLRVATLVGDDGRERTLTIPRGWLRGWSKAESLQSIRDRNFDQARGVLAAWLGAAGGEGSLPEEFRRRSAYLGQWKSCDRLGSLVWWWKDNRIAGDAAIFAEMDAWRTQDRHLHDWQDSQMRKSIRRRDEHYRRFAAIARREYRTIRVEDTDWRELARKPGPDEVSDAAAKAYARVGSVGRLLQFVREAATEVVEVSAANTTRRCHECGAVEVFDAAKELVHRCGTCDAIWDQDRNAAINLLRGPDGLGPFEVRTVMPGWPQGANGRQVLGGGCPRDASRVPEDIGLVVV